MGLDPSPPPLIWCPDVLRNSSQTSSNCSSATEGYICVYVTRNMGRCCGNTELCCRCARRFSGYTHIYVWIYVHTLASALMFFHNRLNLHRLPKNVKTFSRCRQLFCMQTQKYIYIYCVPIYGSFAEIYIYMYEWNIWTFNKCIQLSSFACKHINTYIYEYIMCAYVNSPLPRRSFTTVASCPEIYGYFANGHSSFAYTYICIYICI